MKGLAQSKPSSSIVKVGSRSARKHYGCSKYTDYVPNVHPESRRFRLIYTPSESLTKDSCQNLETLPRWVSGQDHELVHKQSRQIIELIDLSFC